MAMPEALAGPWKISAGHPHAADRSTLSETGITADRTSALSGCCLKGAPLNAQHIGQGRWQLQGAPIKEGDEGLTWAKGAESEGAHAQQREAGNRTVLRRGVRSAAAWQRVCSRSGCVQVCDRAALRCGVGRAAGTDTSRCETSRVHAYQWHPVEQGLVKKLTWTTIVPQLWCKSRVEVYWVKRAYMNPMPDRRRGMPMWKFLSRKRLLLQAM